MKDTYKTILRPSKEVLYKDKGSKFFGYAYPFHKKEELGPILATLKAQHPKAGHFCYAWQTGIKKVNYKVNDDGEPSNSAGQPIYGRILSKGLSNVLIVVIRYFGGTKLGKGGLVQAYKTTAAYALEASKIVTKTLKLDIRIKFDYAQLDKVLRIIKAEKIDILEQKMDLTCNFLISVKENDVKKVIRSFKELKNVEVY